MKLLYIDHYFGSASMGMEYRPYYFAREWMKNGHAVLCVGASYSHLRRQQPQRIGCCKIDGLDYLILRTREYRGNGICRVLNMIDFMLGLFTTARRAILAYKPNIVIASSTYTWDNWAAAYYAKKCGAKYVYELHDIWPLSPMELGGMSKWHPFIWLLQRAENFACKHADKIISVLPAADKHLIEHGMKQDKFTYVPNGVLPDEWEKEEFKENNVANSQFTIGYVGGHALSNSLDTLCEAAKRLADIKFVLVGDGAEKVRLMEKCKDVGNVEFKDPVKKSDVPVTLRGFDCLYIGWTKSPLYRFGISPNKIYDYMMSGRPIVHAVDAANDPVKEAGCGISCLPEDVDALVQSINAMRERSKSDRELMGSRGREYVIRNNLIPDLAKKFLDAI